MKIIAHTANTKISVEEAISSGAHGVETDVWPTSDRRFVVYHDDYVQYPGDGRIPIIELEFDELKKIIPDLLSLEEFLETCNRDSLLFLELKRPRHMPGRYEWVEERLAEILKDKGPDWITLISFDHRSLEVLREMAPELRRGMIYGWEWLTLPEEVEEVAPEVLLPRWTQANPTLVRWAHDRGMEVYPWTVNSVGLARYFRDIEADGLITDCPREIIDSLHKHGGGG